MIVRLNQTDLDGSVNPHVTRDLRVCVAEDRLEIRLCGELGPNNQIITIKLAEHETGDQVLKVTRAHAKEKACSMKTTPS